MKLECLAAVYISVPDKLLYNLHLDGELGFWILAPEIPQDLGPGSPLVEL